MIDGSPKNGMEWDFRRVRGRSYAGHRHRPSSPAQQPGSPSATPDCTTSTTKDSPEINLIQI